MPRLAYVNGRFVPHAKAAVHIEDRGYQFADGVYEVWAVMGGRLSDSAGHFARLRRSLDELRIAMPMTIGGPAHRAGRDRAPQPSRQCGLLYLQVTRGVAPRDHVFPDPPPTPALVITAKKTDPAANEARAMRGAAVISQPENRWGRCDIKTIGLLPNVLAKQAARRPAPSRPGLSTTSACHRGRLQQRLDRRRRGMPAHAGHPGQYPARRHADQHSRHSRAYGYSRGATPVHSG